MFSSFFISLLLTLGTQKASVNADPETSGPASLKPLACGVTSPPNNEVQVTSGQFPWLAAIYRMDNGSWTYTCSGTLISTHIVVTAAHCLSPDDVKDKPEDIKVGLGKHNFHFDSNDKHSIIADVRELVISDLFHGQAVNFAFDVALLDLAVSVKPTPYINPACLLGEATKHIKLDGKGYVAAWSDMKDESQSMQVAYFYKAPCVEKLPNDVYKRYLTPDKMCAQRISGMDADRGSGGAGLTSVNQGVHYVVGVLSTKLPAIYVLADMKNETLVAWLQSEKSRLDALH